VGASALTNWDIALFDAGRTLIRQHPGLAETILAFSRRVSFGLSEEQAELAANASREWANEQNLREYRGAPYLAHEQYLLGFYDAGLAALLPAPPERSLVAELFAFSEESRHWVAMDGARATLEALRRQGRRAGLVSNFSVALREILASQSLLSLLDPVVISAEVGVEKPDPAIMRIACERAGVAPSRAVYVGDHPLDVVCSRRAGVPVIWITDPARSMPMELGAEPDLRAATIAEVPALLGLS
jgi:putative hydrolase of the HAD superfamily